MRLLRIAVASALLLTAVCARADAVRDLVLAAQLDNGGGVERLLAAGASPNTIDPISGEPVLILALREGAQQAIDRLIAAKNLQLEQAAPNGNTALMMAAFKRNRKAVESLLARGAQVNRPGWTALHYAAAGGDDAIVRLLLAKHADIDSRSPSDLTPLMLAAREGQEAAVDTLLKAGADTSLTNNEGLTAVQIAARADKPRIVAAIKAALAVPK